MYIFIKTRDLRIIKIIILKIFRYQITFCKLKNKRKVLNISPAKRSNC